MIAVAATVVAGCGGEGGDDDEFVPTTVTAGFSPGTTVTTSSISRSEYREQANAICEESLARMRKSWARYLRRAHGEYSPALFDEASKNIFVPGLQFWVDDISYLGSPEGDQAPIEAFLKAVQLGVVDGETHPVTGPGRLDALFARADRLARRYGLNSCVITPRSFTA